MFEARGVISLMDDFVGQLGLTNKLSVWHFRGDYKDPWARLGVRSSRKKKVYVVSWKQPPPHYVKLNTDANVSQNRAYGGGLL